MISKMHRRSTRLPFFILLLTAGLAACQAGPALTPTLTASPLPSATPVPLPTATASPAPSPTLAYPAGVLWVDPTQEEGIISPFVLGVNHGPWSDLGLGNIEPAKSAGITFLRWPGGSWGDQNDIQTSQVDYFILQARNIFHAEPSITVRLPNSTPEKAAALVKYVNIDKQYGVKYWSIGNEPSLYESDARLKSLGLNAVTLPRLWRQFAQAMKAVDPTIKLFGPDIHQFTGDPAIDPKDSQGRYYLQEFLKVNGDLVDVVTVHRYPFPSCTTCANPTLDELFANSPAWDNIIINLKYIVKETTGKDLPVGVTEYNSYYSRALGGDTTPDSFNNAVWLADVLGRMIRQRADLLAYWVFKDASSGHGLMTNYDFRPTYYIFPLYSRFGNHLLASNSPEDLVSVFAAKKDDGSLTVMLVNRSLSAVKLPLQLNQGDSYTLSEEYLFDQTHNAESVTPAAFKNGGVVELGERSVTLLIFK